MKKSILKTLIFGLIVGIAFSFLCFYIIQHLFSVVSIAYIFILPIIMGAIPVLFSTKEQLRAYKVYLIMPWLISFSFFSICILLNIDGLICISIIIIPFLLLGTLGAFIFRLIKLKRENNGTKLYASLMLPIAFLFVEKNITPTSQSYTVENKIVVKANKNSVWQNIKNVKNINSKEIETHFIHLIGIPKPLNGEIDIEKVGGVRKITWEKGIQFKEKITRWNEGNGFEYDIEVDPNSIPPKTLDEHVMIGGKYFDVLKGSYTIDSINQSTSIISLNCTYSISTSFNSYSKLWADYILSDFNDMILEVIKKRCEKYRN